MSHDLYFYDHFHLISCVAFYRHSQQSIRDIMLQQDESQQNDHQYDSQEEEEEEEPQQDEAQHCDSQQDEPQDQESPQDPQVTPSTNTPQDIETVSTRLCCALWAGRVTVIWRDNH